MTPQEFLERISNLRAQVRHGHRAPHKTLLLLLMFGRMRQEGQHTIHFREMRRDFRKLIEEFGPKRTTDESHRPFQHLRSDGLWKIENVEQIGRTRARYPRLRLGDLEEKNPLGGFPDEVARLLRTHPALIDAAAAVLLNKQFPESYHDDILAAVRLDDRAETTPRDREPPAEYEEEQDWFGPVAYELSLRRVRNSSFRKRVLQSYGERCAICSYDGAMNHIPLGIEAAHIKWHSHDGPDQVRNGLALCTIHHHAMDRGGITLDGDMNVQVSEQVEGSVREEYFLRFAGEPLRHLPSTPQLCPSQEYLEWHRSEVFKG